MPLNQPNRSVPETRGDGRDQPGRAVDISERFEKGDVVLATEGLTKTFGGLRALSRVDFFIRVGEVVGLVGDNGAGKSTLIKCLAGLFQPTHGTIRYCGSPVAIKSPRTAARLGIEVVHQELTITENLDAVGNVFLGRERTDRFGRLREIEMEQDALRGLERLQAGNIESVRRPLAGFSGGQRQAVAISRAVMASSQIVLLDEPTAALGVAQTNEVLDVVARLAEEGYGVVMISHNLEDIFRVADRVFVLRLGEGVMYRKVEETDVTEVVRAVTTGEAG